MPLMPLMHTHTRLVKQCLYTLHRRRRRRRRRRRTINIA